MADQWHPIDGEQRDLAEAVRIARQRWRCVSPYRKGLVIAEMGSDAANPYQPGTAHKAFETGRAAGAKPIKES